ncbi:sensor histidine kinase [Amphibacillus sp. Q70]|uniref:sensor histidine kinase n=1 Tax=Amphibacillus sp. Q70 TaxID=3453416 RepID=UPI003F8547F9
MKSWIYNNFSLITIRGKVMLLSKFLGVSFVGVFLAGVKGMGNPWIWYALLIVMIMIFDIVLSKIITNPLIIINDTAREIAQLNFTVECDLNTRDELGELSKNLNKLASNLQDALSNLEAAKHRLETDVKQKKLLLAQRKELTDTLSHEMKTPLSVIRAYTEGLMDDVREEKRQEYLNVILSETNRMNDMVVALLDLSALEAGAVTLNPEHFDFVEWVETVAGRLLIDQPTEDFYLSYDLPEESVFVTVDKKRMEQVLSNLISNAKNHVSKHGIIRLSVIVSSHSVEFRLFNQGDPIREEAFPRIWEKFYRGIGTKKKAGTGLGLSIVAQILTMEKIKYRIYNKNDGVEFSFIIKHKSG